MVAVSLVAAGCASDGKATPAPPVQSTAVVSPGSAAVPAVVTIGTFTFAPADLHVAVGTTVTWTNTHDQPHTATSAGNFDTGAIQPGSSASVTFDQAGTYSYICSFHPFMTATVTVA